MVDAWGVVQAGASLRVILLMGQFAHDMSRYGRVEPRCMHIHTLPGAGRNDGKPGQLETRGRSVADDNDDNEEQVLSG